jgi:hypothetical protein
MQRRINVALFLLAKSPPVNHAATSRPCVKRIADLGTAGAEHSMLRTNLRCRGNNMIAYTFYRMDGNKIYSTEISP